LTRGALIGIDHSALMQRMATRRNAQAVRDGRVELLQGPWDLMDSLPSNFDRLYSANVLQFQVNRFEVCAAARRVLRPGGWFAALYQPRHAGATDAHAWRFADALADDLRRAGFAEVHVRRGPSRPLLSVAVFGQCPLAANRLV
jgi:ubiquinone/menaquinone biosynthesis C-methylase UbiE